MPQCVHVLANIDKCMLIKRHNVPRKQRRRRSDPRGPCGIRREGHTPRVNTPTGDASILPETSIQGCRQDTVWRSSAATNIGLRRFVFGLVWPLSADVRIAASLRTKMAQGPESVNVAREHTSTGILSKTDHYPGPTQPGSFSNTSTRLRYGCLGEP